MKGRQAQFVHQANNKICLFFTSWVFHIFIGPSPCRWFPQTQIFLSDSCRASFSNPLTSLPKSQNVVMWIDDSVLYRIDNSSKLFEFLWLVLSSTGSELCTISSDNCAVFLSQLFGKSEKSWPGALLWSISQQPLCFGLSVCFHFSPELLWSSDSSALSLTDSEYKSTLGKCNGFSSYSKLYRKSCLRTPFWKK